MDGAPFWRTKFVLTDPKDLDLIRATAIREVWIDISRGKDVAEGTASLSREEVDARIDTDFSRLEEMTPIAAPPPAPPPPPVNDHAPTSMQGEACAGPPPSAARPNRPWCPCSVKPAWAMQWMQKAPRAWSRKSPTPWFATRRAHQSGAPEDGGRLHLHALSRRLRADGGAGPAVGPERCPHAHRRHGGPAA